MAVESLTIDRDSAQRYLERAFEHDQAEVLVGFAERYGMPAIREDFRELKAVVGQLAEAQRDTQQQVAELTEAQQRTEERMDKLVEAQEGTQKALHALARQVGGLSDSFGGDIEDHAVSVAYVVLTRDLGWEVFDLEPRVYQSWAEELVEVDGFGEGEIPAQPNRPVWILGEAKHNLTSKEVDRFVKLVGRAREHLDGEVFPFLFCYRCRPEVLDAAKQAGLNVLFSNAKLVLAEG